MRSITIGIFLVLLTSLFAYGQSLNVKPLTEEQLADLREEINYILVTDQLFRTPVAYGTLDFDTLTAIKENSKTMEITEFMQYTASLNTSMTQQTKDSLWKIQTYLDEVNHKKYRRIVQKYGYPSEELVGKDANKLFALLLHPPGSWDVPAYIAEMKALFAAELVAGRMPPIDYAKFYDNMHGKILRKPQLYGTNFRYSRELQKVLPPLIEDIEQTNQARAALGLPPLQAGEYELAKEE